MVIGTKLGAYEVIAKLGEGGMGEVYRARDTRLKREVAIKVLPQEFAQDADRLARFKREAELLASLNHPNIAAVYGLEESDGHTAIVLELVDGQTLQQRISSGAIPVDDVLAIAKQIADALEAAHERGVIHRDLKPANIKITADGTVKVLDFGLAKAIETTAGATSASPAHLSFSPTMSVHATMAGMILGTAAYMSPEQARGKPVDRRADIWAFGCVLFEMLSGRQSFAGDTVTDIVAALIKNDPDWTALPADTPAHIRALLKRCLQKDPKRRLRDIGDARLELEEGSQASPDPSDFPGAPTRGTREGGSPAKRALPWVAAGVLGAASVALAAIILLHREPAEPGAVRLTITPPEGFAHSHNLPQRGTNVPAPHFAPSPDGRQIAYVMHPADRSTQLWIRRLDALSGQPLAGTDEASFPFWSPDSRWVGFFAQGKLKKIDVSGGAPQTICDVPAGEGGTWNRDGDIVFASNDAGALSRVSAAGGIPAALTTLDASRREASHRWPQFLPDGRHFLYIAMTGALQSGARVPTFGDDRSLYVGSLDGMAPILIVKGTLRAQYASGRLLFLKDATLMAQPFDTKTFRLTGDPVPLAEQIASNLANGRAAMSVSDGVLTYRIGGVTTAGTSVLAWLDRAGKQLGTIGASAQYASVLLSPGGNAVLTYIQEAAAPGSSNIPGDLWILDLARGGIPVRLTLTSDQAEAAGAWSPDGSRIAYGAGPTAGMVSDLYIKPTSGIGEAELLLKAGGPIRPTSWSPDGRSIVFSQFDSRTLSDVWHAPLAGDRPSTRSASSGSTVSQVEPSTSSGRPEPVEGRKPVPYLQTSFSESAAVISPDGRWIAYVSDKTGTADVYVRPFPAGDREWRVSQGGGEYPQWRGDSKELYYIDTRTPGLMTVAMRGGATLEPALPVRLFNIPFMRNQGRGQYTVTPDGQRFLLIQSEAAVQPATQPPIVVVVNWASGLGK